MTMPIRDTLCRLCNQLVILVPVVRGARASGRLAAMTYRVTFVCTGNICRSPLAEHVLRRHLANVGLEVEVDSSGTGGWHVGDGADRRTVAMLRENGYTSTHRAQQFEAAWFDRYDLIIALDQ